MIKTTKRKSGRPIAYYRTAGGDRIDGLNRKADGRWVISATGKCFTEPEERLAIIRFRQLTGVSSIKQVISQPGPIFTRGKPKRPAKGMVLSRVGPGLGTEALVKTPDGFVPTGPKSGIESMPIDLDCPEVWAFVRQQILERPKYVAAQVGIEQIGYLKDLKEPVKAASLEELGLAYFEHCELSPNELSRSKTFWAEFDKVAKAKGVTTIDGIDHEFAQKYETNIEGKKLAPKSRLHRYRKVRGILHFNIKRGNSIDHCRKALDALAMLEVKDAHPLDPTPISPKDFRAIHSEAIKADDATFAALLLLSLNAALYGGEAAAVRWDEIDFKTGGFVSRRSKTGVSRIAVLWPETLAAVKALPHDRDEEVFCTKVRSYTVHSVGDKFEKYRDAAEVDKAVTFSWIRDAAYSTAMQATDFTKAELLAGHRLPGTADAYLRRNPQLVATACEAIRKAYAISKLAK